MPKWKEWKATIDGKEVRFYRVRGKPEGREVQKIFRSDKHRAAMTQAKNQWKDWDDAERKRRGEDVPPPPANREKKVTFREAARRYLDTRRDLGRERATRHDYTRMIDNHLAPWTEQHGITHMRAITIRDVRALREDLIRGRFLQTRKGKFAGKPVGIVGQRKMFALFKSILAQAMVDGDMDAIPEMHEVHIETPSHLRNKTAKDRVWQWPQVYTLLRAADRLAESPDTRQRNAWGPGGYRALSYVVVFTCMRISECLAIRFRNLDLDGAVVLLEAGIDRYRTEGAGKNDTAYREVDLHPGVVHILRSYIREAGLEGADPGAYLFSTAEGRPMLPRVVHQRCWSKLVEEANRLAKDPDNTDPRLVPIETEGVAWHGFRRFINSLMADSDVQREVLRRFMGHKGEDMTKRYSYPLKGGGTLDDLFRPEDLPVAADTAA